MYCNWLLENWLIRLFNRYQPNNVILLGTNRQLEIITNQPVTT